MLTKIHEIFFHKVAILHKADIRKIHSLRTLLELLTPLMI